MPVPTGGYLIVKAPQYVEETTEGTFPTASPNFQWIGAVEDIKPTTDTNAIEKRNVGSEDVYKMLLGTKRFTYDLTYNPQTSAFYKYGINAQGGGVGTIDKSLAILYSQQLNGVENFFELAGCRINTLKLSVSPGKLLQVDASLIAHNNPVPATAHGLTTPVFATDPATAPFSFSDEGATPVTFGGTNLDITDISVTFGRNLEEIYTLADNKPLYLPPKKREISGSMTIVWTATSNITDLLALTERTLVWTLKSGTSVLTLNNVSLQKLDSLEAAPDKITYETYSFKARSGSVT